METVKIQIVEDELLVAHDLAERLKQNGYEIVAINSSMDEAMKTFRTTLPDIVLLDITIKGTKSGIDIAHAINELQPTPFIYITAHADAVTVNKAKNTFPAAYIVKPFNTNSLLVSIELALHNFAYHKEDEELPLQNDKNIYLKQNYLFIKDGHKFVKVLLQDILYLSAEDNYVKIVCAEKSFLIRKTLTKTLELLHKDFFKRVHRSYGINTNRIDSFTEHEIVISENIIPIGRAYKEELTNIFKFR